MTDAPPHPVARLLEAANDHDTDAFRAGFTDDGVEPVAVRDGLVARMTILGVRARVSAG